MLAPCGSRTYLSWTCGYACSEIAVTSSRPSSAHSFSVWMSFSTCSNSNSRGSTSPDASPQNMNASSGSGLCPRRINKAARAYLADASKGSHMASPCASPFSTGGRKLPVPEEPALERAEELFPGEGPDVLRAAVVLGDARVVVEDPVRVLEHVLELVPFEDVVVAARLVAR